MLEGLVLRILAVSVTVLTVVLGAVCVTAGWGEVVSEDPSTKVPHALYTLTLAFIFQVAGLLILLHIPYDLSKRRVFGTGLDMIVWISLLLASFALCVSTWWLARKPGDRATSFLRNSSILLLTIWVVAFVAHVVG
jgi:hypothetical protein